ncbi:MAG: hypothetical protein H8E44_05125 [Planctomycetes bacterium]|nr:hypothetical protein [Planctomycetota bacterium]MBL7037284.1 hypothetical protein [Pirellulaceae bacterium]
MKPQIASDYGIWQRVFLWIASCTAACCLTATVSTAAELSGQNCRLAIVPDQPLSRDRNTTLLARFDARDDSNANFARVHGDEMGHNSDPTVDGKFGGGVAVHGENGFLLYSGLDNCPRLSGTVEFWVRSDSEKSVWADGIGHWLMVLYPERAEYDVRYGMQPNILSLYKTPTNHLVFKLFEGGVQRYNLGSRLARPDTGKSLSIGVEDLDAKTWHHFLCSWDLRPPGRLWLLVDGVGTTAELDRAEDAPEPNPGNFILLGGLSGLPGDKIRTSECAFDDFRIQSATVTHRLREPLPPKRTVGEIDETRLLETEDAVRSMLDFLLQLQFEGGLLPSYSWPALDSSGWGDIGRGVDMWFPASAKLGETLIRAWRIWGDERYLDGAIEAANMFCETQFPEGAWAYAYTYSRGRMLPKNRRVYIAQAMQSNQIRFLSLMSCLLGDERYEQAIRKAGDWHASIQFPSGAWGWEGYPLDHKGPYGHPALNDIVTPQAMWDLFVIWCATGEDKYLRPLEQAGQWLIDAQSGPPMYGWADQYDENNNFIWMRNFEPPAVSMQAVWSAARGLVFMYDLTGDPRYLEPLRKVLTWMESVPEKERGWLWYAHRDYSAEENFAVIKTPDDPEGIKQGVAIRAGEPVVAYYRELLPVTHDKAVREIIPRLAAHYGVKHRWIEDLVRQALEERADGPVFPGRFGKLPRIRFAETAPSVADYARQFNQSPRGAILEKLAAFARGEPGDLVTQHRDYGWCFNPNQALNYCEQVLDDIEAARVAAGDFRPGWIPRYGRWPGGSWVYMDPGRDFLASPLAANNQ